uniref:Uncharacterized protein n=1 Tax=Aplanochytrium stocchinoi TaxID=215587 RepID=A0A7S3LQS1_9STRA|mmetsp:Transcript_10224/g.11622  ORF Transcript_10224/g.11622 Transcript_10224/m.11622 type:complete len:197 (+) Transcript_10224:82-672(+)
MGSSSKHSTSHRSNKKKKKSSKKDSKKHHSHKKERKRKDKDKDKESRSRKSENEHSVENPITVDDYYNKNAEFRIWLNNSKGIHFSDCNEPRKYFEKFVKAWNKGKLDKMIYQGHIPAELRVASMSKHSWGFENKLNDQEQLDISALAERVDRETDFIKLNKNNPVTRARPANSDNAQQQQDHDEESNSKKRRRLD